MSETSAGQVSGDAERLVLQAQRGSRRALAVLVEQHESGLVRFARRLVGAEAADDLVQETLLRATQSIQRLAEPARFGPWLYGIAANLAKKAWQRRARWPLSLDRLSATYPDVPWLAAPASVAYEGPELLFEEREQAARLAAAVNELPGHLRRVLVLHYLDGLSYAEVAAALNVPVSTVKGRLFKSRARLRRDFAGRPEETGTPSVPLAGTLTGVHTREDEPKMLNTSTPGEPRLVPMAVESLRMNVADALEPTIENVKAWLSQGHLVTPFEKDGDVYRKPAEYREPDLQAIAERIAPVLAQHQVHVRPTRVLFLKDMDGRCLLPIIIGTPEADAIAIKLQGVEAPRPLSHDLMATLLSAHGLRVERIVISGYRSETKTYFAEIRVRRGRGKTRAIDARPSDAIALAVRVGAPIYVSEQVLHETGVAVTA